MHLGDAYYKGRSNSSMLQSAISTYEESVEFNDQAGNNLP